MRTHSGFRLAGVMGWPIAHSRSPRIHNFWLNQYAIDGVYIPLAIEPVKLEGALRALPQLNFLGCNLTIPHKERALNFVDEVTPEARRIGAINCVVVEDSGRLTGKNYDAYGFIASLTDAVTGWEAARNPCVVLGAGGAARAVVCGLIDAGAQEIRLLNRTLDRAQAIAQDFGSCISIYDWEERHEALVDAGLLVNTTNQGMVGQPPLDIKLDLLPKSALVADIVYAPLETPLLAQARRHGAIPIDGLGMLMHQARPAFRDWTGVMPHVTADLRRWVIATLSP
ncbi:MAG: shikimate dehydrogenase [Alphaproteobacteria bacterium]|nr:shikimate dehydrogenase [Alphaproteobacteria bacterium]